MTAGALDAVGTDALALHWLRAAVTQNSVDLARLEGCICHVQHIAARPDVGGSRFVLSLNIKQY